MNKKEKQFLIDDGWEYKKGGFILETDEIDSEYEKAYYPSLKDIPYKKIKGYWYKDDMASDDEEEVLEMAGYDEK